MPLKRISPSTYTAVAALALLLLTILAYWPALGNDFVPFDDVIYVLENPPVRDGLQPESIAWAFSTYHGGNWHPLTWLSHMLDATVYGLDPFGHHLSSILGHMLASVLLLLALRSLTGALWRGFAVAVLFAVHPLHVESVAWISERKDVLCAIFWFAALWTYARYVRAPSFWRYLLVALLFALGLMAKSMIVTLPLLLLVLDYWPLGRFGERGAWSWRQAWRLVLEKLPLLAMTLGISLATMIAQGQYGAMNSWEVLPLEMRVFNALRAYLAYLGKTFWPEGLAVLYPFPEQVLLWQELLFAGALALITLGCVWMARKAPYLLTGWLWYLGTLVPVIGIVQVGIQSMADRYTYVPLVGVFLALVWGGADLAARIPRGRVVALVGLALVAALLISATWRQSAVWKDGETLLAHALAVVPEHHEARYNLGGVLHTKGDHAGAVKHLEPYVRTHPHNARAVEMLVQSLLALERYRQMLPYLELALRHHPGDPRLLAMQGYALYKLGAFEQAAASLKASLAKNKKQPRTEVLLGLSLLWMGQMEEARTRILLGLEQERDAAVSHSLNFLVRNEAAKLAGLLEAKGLAAAAAQVRTLFSDLP